MQGDYTLKHGIFITPIGRLPAHRAVAPGAGTARGASLRFCLQCCRQFCSAVLELEARELLSRSRGSCVFACHEKPGVAGACRYYLRLGAWA